MHLDLSTTCNDTRKVKVHLLPAELFSGRHLCQCLLISELSCVVSKRRGNPLFNSCVANKRRGNPCNQCSILRLDDFKDADEDVPTVQNGQPETGSDNQITLQDVQAETVMAHTVQDTQGGIHGGLVSGNVTLSSPSGFDSNAINQCYLSKTNTEQKTNELSHKIQNLPPEP